MSSSNTTVEPPAVKKRGRPKKVIVEDVGKPLVAETKKTATVKKAAVKTVAAKSKAVEPKKERKTVVKKDAPEQPTPVTPATSKILEEVRAKGTLKKTLPTKADKTESGGDVTKTAAATVQSKPASLPSSSQTNPPIQEAQATPPLIQHTTTATTSPPTYHQQQRTSTIPLPRKPISAPSPLQPLSHTTVRSSTSPRPQQPPPPSQAQAQQQAQKPAATFPPNPYPNTTTTLRRPPAFSHHHPNTRIIEPTPDIRLPPKYKPAARRVTAIIVSLPIVIVFGYELWARWRGKEIRGKFEDRHPRVERKAVESSLGGGE